MRRILAVRENRTRLCAIVLAAQICGAGLAANAQEALRPGDFKAFSGVGVQARTSDFSGLPVPRYSSLRYDQVNGRAGPSLDYPVQWSYERLGLPVVIVRESQDWRKIRDPQGDEVWVHSRMLAEQRTAMAVEPGAIRRQPSGRSPATATYDAGAVVTLGACENGWCRVEAEGRKGWAAASELWGADELPRPAPSLSASRSRP
jgi:SH3-like domain-containing protein